MHATLVPVLPNNRFDEAALAKYLQPRVPGFRGECAVLQFQGGFSNPTFHLQTADHAFVLRKKPPGTLLPSAHAVDREYTVLKALQNTDVPVPRVHLLCEDASVIGTMFYVMDYVDGRVFTDRALSGCSTPERTAMHEAACDVLASLHSVDYRSVGLDGFGKPTGYLARQVARWSKQYAASMVEELPAMTRLMEWLPAHMPADDEAAITHGDYRIGNLLFHPSEPRVVAVLDWELSTIGHPLSDLAYICSSYHLPAAGGRGYGDLDIAALGIPLEEQVLERYCRRTGRAELPHWKFFIVFSLFRSVAILAGVYKRAIDGQGVDPRMRETKQVYQEVAERAWTIALTGG
jgi:aminoglycoside phosphotransferase (APT) family kinase protein